MKKTAVLTLAGSFLVLGLFATAHGSGRGSGYYDRGSRYEYRGDYRGRYYNDNRYGYRGSGYERGSRYEYRGDRRYYDDRYRGDRRYSDDDRYEYRGNGRRPIPARVPTNTGTSTAPATVAPTSTAPTTAN